MKISLNWLRQYLDTGDTVDKIAERLTNIGLEVEGVTNWTSHPGGLQGLVTGEVLTAEKHPNADKLKITKVNVGESEPLSIVCGAPNVAVGQKVIVATVGTRLYPADGESFEIKKSKIRGQVSMGMICAEDEIGVGTSHDGIIVLEESTPVGQKAAALFNVEQDHILDIGLTANRSDANSHIGTARDLAGAITATGDKNWQISPPDLSAFAVHHNEAAIKVSVENHEACPRYSGISLTGVKIGPSPAWLKNRLESIGVKSINNVVDVTNFVLHEYGQPLHAFDIDKITSRKIVVKTAEEGSPFVTLDNDERKLNATDLMITDGEKGLCIAGVYGGLGSGITDHTTNIFLESACFDPLWIRRTSTTHGLRTDAASHFEKGTDPNGTVDALKRATLLIIETGGGQVGSELTDIYPEPVQPWKVSLHYTNMDRLVGQEIPHDEVKAILPALGIEILEETKEGLELAVPTFKTDVLREADVIEEVLRIYGMDRIELPPFLRSNIVIERSASEQIRNTVSEFLSGAGYTELFTNPITRSGYLKMLPEGEHQAVFLENSLNADLDVMRPTMLFGGLESIAYNRNRRQQDLRFYEFGHVFMLEGEGFNESSRLTLFQTGKSKPENWAGSSPAASYFDIKTTVLQILERLGASVQSSSATTHPLLSYGQDFTIYGKRGVSFGAVSARVLAQMDIKMQSGEEVLYAELDWNLLSKKASRRKTEYKPVSKYPTVRRDLALVLDTEVVFAQVDEIARSKGGKLLNDVVLFDVYEGKNLGPGKKSYGIGLIFQDSNRTLTDKQVDKVMKQLIQTYESDLKATIRR